MKDLGNEMPMRVIGMLLGIPESDQNAVRDMRRPPVAHRARQAHGHNRTHDDPHGQNVQLNTSTIGRSTRRTI